MEQHPKPIFYDERGRRWPAIVRTWAVLALVLSVLAAVFAASIVASPLLPSFAWSGARRAPGSGGEPIVGPRLAEKEAFALARARSALNRIRARHRRARRVRARVTDGKPLSVVAGFYVNWNPMSFTSLTQHADALTHLIPEWIHLTPDGAGIRTEESQKVIAFAAEHKLPVLPLLNNADGGDFQPARLHALLRSPAAQARVIAQTLAFLGKYHFRGLNLDLENAAPGDRARMTAFAAAFARALHRDGYLLSQDIPMDDSAYDLAGLGAANDLVIPMLYDVHDSTSPAGPIAPEDWFEDHARQVYEQVPPDKVVLGIGSYGYDWTRGQSGAASLDYEEAVLAARDSQQAIALDPASGNPHVSYVDDQGQPHDVWLLDAVTAYNEVQSQRPYQPLGAAVWALGSEDPSLWTFFHRAHLGGRTDPKALESIAFSQQADFEGRGELLDVVAQPTSGRRSLTVDGAGNITGERYSRYPSPYVIRRYGDQKRSIALTFDDGPDPVWTPRILDILHHYGVPATFFVVGSNAEKHPDLVRREYADGHEIGNHTYYHPDISQTGALRERLELTATQRAIESLTGHSTHLFRPPYTVDTAPEAAAQIRPLLGAESMGYITVGANIDPDDWARPGVQQILWGGKSAPGAEKDIDYVDGVLPLAEAGLRPGADAAHIILLHDAGGDRSQTVAALPRIIEGLRARGFQFTTVSGLMGYTDRATLMPAVTGRQEILVGADKAWFDLSYSARLLLQALFLSAIFLGVGRVLLMAALAGWQRHTARLKRFDPAYRPSVSVLIAAYNEAPVIERTVRAILDSEWPDLEVVVVDDGSTDGTAGVVRRAFREDLRVLLLEKENGGKASALNLGLRHARGAVVVTLDADTLFTPETIPLLARHFEDPAVAAVAGNVKVGNRVNLWTLWQSLEYITSQNFDRRAYAALNCITVVPGAIGAWRRRVLEEVGGYRADTLAEDTDLTLRVLRAGYRIETESEALAYTEAPDSAGTLARQRFRWSFGTLQCLWKHRDTLGRRRYGSMGFVALPALWTFQILFQAISPVVDVMILVSALTGGLHAVLFYYAAFYLVDMAGSYVAVRWDGEDPRLLLWMFWQRFAYRQVMYYIIARSLLAALRGGRVGWGKLQRKGTVTVAAR